MKPHELHLSVRILPDGHQHLLKLPSTATLLDVIQEGARQAGTSLLPTAEQPLDRLHNIGKHHEVGPPIEDLDQSAADFLSQPGHTDDFGIELVLAIRLNTQWQIATQPSMSPREILRLFGLDFQEYTLYRPMSGEPLPLDAPISLSRGDGFEAQRDGKYGGSKQ